MSRALWVLHTLAGHWRRNPLQAAAVLAGLMLATALWSAVQALNAQARQDYAQAAALLGGDRLDRLVPGPGAALDREGFAALRRAGWAVSPVLEGRVLAAGRSWRLIGVEPLTLPEGAIAAALAAGGTGEGPAGFLLPPWQILAAPETLAGLGVAEGGRATLADGRALPPARAAPRLPPGVLVTDIGAAEQLLGRPGAVDALLLDPSRDRPAADWRTVPGAAGLELRRPEPESALDRLTDSFHLNLTAFGFLAFVVGLFITHAAVGLAFEQRRGVLRTLRACGVSAAELTAVLLVELVAAALLAGAAGVAAGHAIAAALLPDVAASLRGLYGAEVAGSLSLPASWWLAGLGMSLGGGLLAAGHTLARAFSMPVLASARPQAWHAAQVRTLWRQAAVAAAALAAGLALWLWAGRLGVAPLFVGFGAMAALLLGAALLLPGLLAGALALLARRARAPVLHWAVADARQQLSGLSLALMALLIALAANIGVGSMVESFRATFLSWLDQRLFAEVYYTAPDTARDAEIAAWLAARPEVAAVLPTREADAAVGGWPVEVVGRTDHPEYRAHFPLLRAGDGAWDRLAAGTGALVSEQFATRLGLGLGDRFELPTPSGDWPLEIAAIHADYGNPSGQVTVSLTALEARWPGLGPGGTGVRVAPPAAAPALMAAMEARFALGAQGMIDNAALKDFSRRVFERTFAVTAMLNVLTLAVAGAALFLSLATLAELRLPQLAPMWALGLTRAELGMLELARTLGLALMTALAAVPLGLGVAWLLVSEINVAAFGWRLPLLPFPGQWLALVGLAALTALAAAALPAWRLARTSPSRLLKIFAEER